MFAYLSSDCTLYPQADFINHNTEGGGFGNILAIGGDFKKNS